MYNITKGGHIPRPLAYRYIMNESTNESSTPETRRRRPKAQVSCNLCHRRKLKCDRGKPCQSCSYRGLSRSCSYEQHRVVDQPARKRPTALQAVRNNPATLEDVQIHLTELEALLVALRTTSTGYFDTSGVAEPNRDSQWTAVMHRVAELKQFFNNQSDASPESPKSRAAVNEEPTTDSLPASDGSTSLQQSEQTSATTWKKHPLPWLQHFYVPDTYDGTTNDAAPVGTGMVIH